MSEPVLSLSLSLSLFLFDPPLVSEARAIHRLARARDLR